MPETTKMLCAGVAIPLLLACGCDDDDDAPALLPPAFDLAGTWEVYTTPDGGSEVGPLTGIIQQNGNSLLVYDDTGVQLVGSGTISGKAVRISLAVGPGVYATLTGTATSADHVDGTYAAPGEIGTWRCERVP